VFDNLGPRRLARELRHAPDRLLHGRRRAELTRRLRARPPASVLFVCHGNICRSPFAEAVARRVLAERRAGTRLCSAGFFGPGRPAPETAVEAARAHGVDLVPHRSQLLTPALVRGADLILVMDAGQRAAVAARFGRHGPDVAVLGDLDPEPITRRAIHDPVEQPREVFEASYARIARCVRALVEAIAPEA
jgi:protein-tyrosine phosphatase